MRSSGWPRGQGGQGGQGGSWRASCGDGGQGDVRETNRWSGRFFLLLILHFASAKNKKEEVDAALIELNELKNNFV